VKRKPQKNTGNVPSHREKPDPRQFQQLPPAAPPAPPGAWGTDANYHPIDPTASKCLARMVRDGRGRERFYVKRATSGVNAYYNPQTELPHLLVERVRATGRLKYDWEEVTPDAYKFYLKFLETGNPAFYRQVQRTF
jgi:hypothetical protein